MIAIELRTQFIAYGRGNTFQDGSWIEYLERIGRISAYMIRA